MNKKEYPSKPDKIAERWPGEFEIGSWHDALTGIPSQLVVVSGWKENGRENACLQSGVLFTAAGGQWVCVIGEVPREGHMYRSLRDTGCCVVNFPARELREKCFATIENNGPDKDEITASGLTAEPAAAVNAPRIAECFLNVECRLLWEQELFPGSSSVTMGLQAVHISMDSDRCVHGGLGRYGKDGYLYYISSPRDPETGEGTPVEFGVIEAL